MNVNSIFTLKDLAMHQGVISNLMDTSLTIYNFIKTYDNIFKSLIVITLSLGLSRYLTSCTKKSLSKKIKSPFRYIDSYRRFWSTSASTRKNLITLFIFALCYLIFLQPLGFKVIENVSYSIVAAFIFDAFLNYHQENEKKKNACTKWGFKLDQQSILWTDFLRFKKELKFQGTDGEFIFEIIFNNFNPVKSLPIKDVIYGFNDIHPIKSTISNQNEIKNYAKDIICNDMVFISNFYKDPDIFVAFPNIKTPAFTYHQYCHIFHMSITGSLNNQNLQNTIKKFFDAKNKFHTSITENIDLYR